MVRVRDQVVIDRDVALRPQLVDELLYRARSDDFVGFALDDDARGRAGGEEAEVVHVGGRRDRDEASDLRTAHQQLHAYPGAEADPRDPCGLRFGMDRLNPVERGCRVGKLADAIVEHTLALADPAEVEPQGRKAALDEGL